jgi:hypothetical protein
VVRSKVRIVCHREIQEYYELLIRQTKRKQLFGALELEEWRTLSLSTTEINGTWAGQRILLITPRLIFLQIHGLKVVAAAIDVNEHRNCIYRSPCFHLSTPYLYLARDNNGTRT